MTTWILSDLEIQRELWHPKMAREVSRLSRNRGQGSVSRSPEKPFVKLPTACFGKPIFSHVFKVTKSKMTVKLDDLNPLRTWDTKGIVTQLRKWPVKYRDFRETGPKPQFFKRWIALSAGWITNQWISHSETNCTIQWIMIYPVDNVNHLLNNWGQKYYYRFRNTFFF